MLPWVEKYRPKDINEIISNEQNINIIKNMLLNGSLPHLLFHGTSGTGKTSLIIALAKKIYKNNMNLMVMKLDASDVRGINSVREEIKGFAEKKNMFKKGVKLIILDEADSMTFDAQFALRRIIEKYSESTRFCLICNYENKIIPAIRSRCANFRFNPIKITDIILVLQNICNKEKLNINDESINIIALLSNGDLRKSINLLQSISMYDTIVTPNICYEFAGLPNKTNINLIYLYLTDNNINFSDTNNKLIEIIKNNGYSLSIILKEIILILLENLNEKNNKSFAYILSDLADLENKIAKSTFNDIYISSLVSIFKNNNKII
jgi:replication factor C subunit 3/5